MSLYRSQFRKTLENVDWMDEATRTAALEKADSMASHIAYPSEMMDDEKLTNFYEGVNNNNISLRVLFSSRNLSCLKGFLAKHIG